MAVGGLRQFMRIVPLIQYIRAPSNRWLERFSSCSDAHNRVVKPHRGKSRDGGIIAYIVGCGEMKKNKTKTKNCKAIFCHSRLRGNDKPLRGLFMIS
jgi:hypothetical protein